MVERARDAALACVTKILFPAEPAPSGRVEPKPHHNSRNIKAGLPKIAMHLPLSFPRHIAEMDILTPFQIALSLLFANGDAELDVYHRPVADRQPDGGCDIACS